MHWQSGQSWPTPSEQAVAEAFAAESIQAQLATGPVGEAHATALLRTAYHQAREPAPQHIRWVDGPLELVETLLRMRPHMSAWGEDQWKSSEPNLRWPGELQAQWGVQELVREGLEDARREKCSRTGWWGGQEEENWEIQQNGQIRAWLERLEAVVSIPMREQVAERVGGFVQARVEAEVRKREPSWEAGRSSSVEVSGASVQVYVSAPEFTVIRFFARASRDWEALALADLNLLVSGYWLARDQAILVRRPTRLERDGQGRLHSASGPAHRLCGWLEVLCLAGCADECAGDPHAGGTDSGGLAGGSKRRGTAGDPGTHGRALSWGTGGNRGG